jgi:hypothetical protein
LIEASGIFVAACLWTIGWLMVTAWDNHREKGAA